MELELILDFVGKGLKKINSDVEKLRSEQFNYEDILDNLSSEIIMLENHIQYFSQLIQPVFQEENGGTQPENGTEQEEGTQEITLEQLAQYNGKNGQPAYVAVNGVVYNVTNNPLWAGGSHFFGLTAGRNLTSEFQMCHPGAMVLSVLPVVGTLVTEQTR